MVIINRAKSLCNAFLSCRANTYANVDSWCEFTIWCSILPASTTRIQGNESSHLYVLGTALSWKWHHSPWPGARCPPRPPEPGGSLSPPLEWQRDWPGIPPARPSSGCPSALGSFPFSDPPGAPSELPSQAYQRAGKKESVSEWLIRWLEKKSVCGCRDSCVSVSSFNPVSGLMTTNGKGWWMCLRLISMTFYQLRFSKMPSPFVYDSLFNSLLYEISSRPLYIPLTLYSRWFAM